MDVETELPRCEAQDSDTEVGSWQKVLTACLSHISNPDNCKAKIESQESSDLSIPVNPECKGYKKKTSLSTSVTIIDPLGAIEDHQLPSQVLKSIAAATKENMLPTFWSAELSWCSGRTEFVH